MHFTNRIVNMCCLACSYFIGVTAFAQAASPPNEKLRVIVETDIGGNADDQASLVRFLLYSNEWAVEGIIADRGSVTIRNADSAAAKLIMPVDASGKTIHVVLVITDDGEPSLTRYRRAVIHCQSNQ